MTGASGKIKITNNAMMVYHIVWGASQVQLLVSLLRPISAIIHFIQTGDSVVKCSALCCNVCEVWSVNYTASELNGLEKKNISFEYYR